DIEARRRRLLIIDTQVERRNRLRSIERELDGHAAALVKHGGHDAAVKNAGLDVADENRAVGQAGPRLATGDAVEPKAADESINGATRFNRLDEPIKRQRCVR